ncbi:MAG TPA: DUF2254 family protein [Geobacterales bacterium]|nr:DUF2254 family protein [Geobacterales bacterium]
MRWVDFLQYSAFLAVLTAPVRPLGGYLARVFTYERTFLDPLMTPIEGLIIRLLGPAAERDMKWREYFLAFMAFGLVSVAIVFALLKFQQYLPFYGVVGTRFLSTPMTGDLAINTSVSFATTTTWQAYAGESTMSYFSQIVVLGVPWLIFFIHHISQAISVNHIVDRIARETERVIDDIMPDCRPHGHDPSGVPYDDSKRETSVDSATSGYIRYFDTKRLLELAKKFKVRIRLLRRVGQFVPEGVPLFSATREERLDKERVAELRSAFDIGPTRTLQQDAEFGVIQIVDIALKAISPAVNDPSTAITCIDQLGRIMIRFVNRSVPASVLCGPPHVVRVIIPWIAVEDLLETAFEQIRHYSASDIAVSLRLLRAFDDIASTCSDPRIVESLVMGGRRIVANCAKRLEPPQIEKLRGRLSALEARVTAAPET